jgi:glycosyltransferase involved in cell wall biosynthesis
VQDAGDSAAVRRVLKRAVHTGPESALPARVEERSIAVVIIARNEAAQIGDCVESVLAGTAAFPGTMIVVVDSDSTDGTAAVAARYPVTVYRYRAARMTAAAGRWIGAQHVKASYTLFIDGDCRLVPGWLEVAVATMERSSTTAVICGGRQNAYAEPGRLRLEDAGWDLGGTALYRTDVLTRAGGFNPFITGNEEQELLARILALGYHKMSTPELMAVHHTGVKESVNGLWRRHRNGMLQGPGQVLRASLSAGTFWYHAAVFNRYLLTLLFLVIGIVCTIVAPWHRAFLAAWLSTALTAIVVLGVRQGSVGAAAFIIADWVLVAVNAVPAFLRGPRGQGNAFVYELELVSAPTTAEPAGQRTD